MKTVSHPVHTADVTVIIPTYNRERFIIDAIDSCLSQASAVLHLDIVVVDDGSTDATTSLLQPLSNSIRCVSLPVNQGRNRARNVGLEHAIGEYVKFLDSDDVLEKGSLAQELATARAESADIVVSGWRNVEMAFSGPSKTTSQYSAPVLNPIIDSLLAGRAVPTGAALYSRQSLGDLRWDENLRKLDDWDWFIRAALKAKKISSVNVTSYSWRSHPGQGIHMETMLNNALEHHIILGKLERSIAKLGILTDARKKRLAQYYYKEIRVLALRDEKAFEYAIQHIHELDPNFAPIDEEKQWWMRFACRVIGLRRTLQLHSRIKLALCETSAD